MHCDQGNNTVWEEHYVKEFKKKDFKKGKETTDVLRSISDKLFPFLDERQVIWWMDSGTLLGAYRNFDLIPHDDDLDIVVLERDYEKIRGIPFPYPLVWKDSLNQGALKGEIVDSTCGLKCDVYVFQEKDDKIGTSPYLWTCKGCNNDFWLPVDVIFPLKRSKFGNVYGNVPNNTEVYLQYMYGDTFQTPDKEYDNCCDNYLNTS